MKSGTLSRGCTVLAIVAVCTLVPVSATQASISEAGITAQVNTPTSWSFVEFVSQIWSRLVGIETHSGSALTSDG